MTIMIVIFKVLLLARPKNPKRRTLSVPEIIMKTVEKKQIIDNCI